MEYIAKRTAHISIHAPRTGSDPAGCWRRGRGRISIHAPRTGSDGDFSSGNKNLEISIHAPRTGSDSSGTSGSGNQYHFNPRSPHGERRDPSYPVLVALEFQSTLPARGATVNSLPVLSTHSYFNPRSPHGERPAVHGGHWRSTTDFNPRSPHGERLPDRGCSGGGRAISIHAPRTGSDGHVCREGERLARISIHAPRTGSDPAK